MGDLWASAHIEKEGNEATDRAAKNATKFPKIFLNIHPLASDLTQLLRRHVFKN